MSKVNHRANAVSNLLNFSEDKPVRREDKGERRSKHVPRRQRMLRYVFDANAQTAPKAGDTIAVRHKSEEQSNGSARLVRASVDVRTIKAVYLSDTDGYQVMDQFGEPWLVRPSALGNAKWETFTKGETRKEFK